MRSCRTATADSSSAVAAWSRDRPCQPRTTTSLDVPSATPVSRPVRAATDATPIAIVAGSRTVTASGPKVRASDVDAPIAVPRANASHVAISPIQSSGYPAASAARAVSRASSGGRSCHSPNDTESLTPHAPRVPPSPIPRRR